MKRGYYIVIEGAEGVGKTTQLDELGERLAAAGITYRRMREPASQSELTARAIRNITQDPRYPMNTRTEVLLYNAARSQSLDVIKKALENGVTCIVDRSYLTTLGVQYYGRGDIPNYEDIDHIIKFAVGDMEPDLMMVLDTDTHILRSRLKNRRSGERFDDLDEDFLERVRNGYLEEAKRRNLPIIDAGGSVDETSGAIWKHVSDLLKSRGGKKKVVATNAAPASAIKEVIEAKQNPYAVKNDNKSWSITEEGKKYLEDAVTSTDDDVYVFTEKLSGSMVAAAMARLSRRFDDMRITILDEFADKEGKDEGLLRRVITAYGDDSVQQLTGVHFVVEGASNWLTKKLEWGRLAAYLEQSTRYIFYDQKDERGNYKYVTPTNLDAQSAKNYEAKMNEIFDLYSEMVHKLTTYVRTTSSTPKEERDGPWKAATRAQACDIARAVLPVATKSTVGIYASGQALESLIMHLLAEEMTEAQHVGKRLLDDARQVVPVFLERADKPDRGGATIAYMANTRNAVRNMADEKLPQNLSPETEDVQLIDYFPKNEMDLVPHMLYEHSSLPLHEIQKEVAEWSYEDKIKVFSTYYGERLNRRHKPGRALEQAHYSWDLVCDYGIFRDLQRHRIVDDLRWQELSPRYGYDVPQELDEAGVTDLFEKCFDISYQLYSELQAAGYHNEAQYATLMGHKMRWKIMYNAREAFHLHELRTTPHGHSGYRKLVNKMHEELARVHPLIAEGMLFVNQDEDPELARLASERYTKYKLEVLDKTLAENK